MDVHNAKETYQKTKMPSRAIAFDVTTSRNMPSPPTNHRKISQTKNYLIIATAAILSICLTQENTALYYFGIVGTSLLIITTLFSPWLGLLSLYPITYALPPAPTTITAKEILFSVLFATIFISTFAHEYRKNRDISKLKTYCYTLMAGLFLVAINLGVSIKNNILLADWIRGVIPFLFIFQFLPISVLIEKNEEKIRLLGCSIAVLILMIASYIIFFYFYHGVWQPYWITSIDGIQTKISEAEATHLANAIGPMRDRITMQVAQATDALLPIGLVAGVVLSTLARRKIVISAGILMALTCMPAVLITFTRSMLLSAVLTIALFSLFILLFRKSLRLKLLSISTILIGTGLSFIFATGMQDIWIGRMSTLVEVRPLEIDSTAYAQPMPTTTKKMKPANRPKTQSNLLT